MGRSKRHLFLFLFLAAGGFGTWRVGREVWGHSELRSARAALQRRDFPTARARLDRCPGLWPHDAATLLLAAQAARRGGDLGEADRLLREYRRQHGQTSPLALEAALLRFQGGDLKEAGGYLAFCKQAPDSPETPLILEAVILGGLRSAELEWAMRGVELWLGRAGGRADRVQGLAWRGAIWIQSGSLENALPDFSRARELDSENDEVRLHWLLASSLPPRSRPGRKWNNCSAGDPATLPSGISSPAAAPLPTPPRRPA